MKKFIMTSPYQKEGGLNCTIYHAMDNTRLQYNKAVSFPILPVIHGYAEKGESIEVLVILSDYINAEKNLEIFQKELQALCTEMGISYQLTLLRVPYDDTLDTQLHIFSHLIEHLGDNDSIYTCITYGTKATPLVEMLALNYCYRLHQNVDIGCIVYGAVDFNTKMAKIYDVTSLFYMDEMIRTLADNKVKDPAKTIRMLLSE